MSNLSMSNILWPMTFRPTAKIMVVNAEHKKNA
jgi:hypothetical protein